MITQQRIEELIGEKLAGTPIFAVSVAVHPGNNIQVLIDGDEGVSISDCVDVSRHIEGSLDREIEDFELKVSSAGADQPLQVRRQYNKHVGRELRVKMNQGETVQGKLTSNDEETIVLEWRTKERIEGRKAKHWVDHKKQISLDEVEEAKVILSFK